MRFLLDGEVVTLDEVNPTSTVLDLLRTRLRRTGTKEGCAEGDCGACTVLVGESGQGGAEVVWRAVNACIMFVPMLDGRALMTVESLGTDQALNPVQQAMVDLHGSQCGFCTPGFVMSLQGAAMGALGSVGTPTKDVIAGNLCRCTGYGPILAAAQRTPPQPSDPALPTRLSALRRDAPLSLSWTDVATGQTRRWFAPQTVDQLAELYLAYPNARILAGGTDVGLWVTKQLRELETVIWLGEVGDLRTYDETPDGLLVRAGVRYSEAYDALARLHPEFGELLRRLGALQVRNAGTICGNIANGSPIGDMPPALIAMGATLILRRGGVKRELPLEDFFLSYGRQNRQPGEFVEAVRIPRPEPNTRVRLVKLSKRFDSDISAVCAAFAITLHEGRVSAARIAFGGMAGTPARARACEAALIGQPWTEATVVRAADALAQDYTPLTDVRGSSAYRTAAAANLLKRFWREEAGLAGAGLMALEAVHA